jgi:hypothetical protein
LRFSTVTVKASAPFEAASVKSEFFISAIFTVMSLKLDNLIICNFEGPWLVAVFGTFELNLYDKLVQVLVRKRIKEALLVNITSS